MLCDPASHAHLPQGVGKRAPCPIHHGKFQNSQGKRRLHTGQLPGGLQDVLAWEACWAMGSTSTGNLHGQQATTMLDTPQVPTQPDREAAEPASMSSVGSLCAAVGLGTLVWAPATSLLCLSAV